MLRMRILVKIKCCAHRNSKNFDHPAGEKTVKILVPEAPFLRRLILIGKPIKLIYCENMSAGGTGILMDSDTLRVGLRVKLVVVLRTKITDRCAK